MRPLRVEERLVVELHESGPAKGSRCSVPASRVAVLGLTIRIIRPMCLPDPLVIHSYARASGDFSGVRRLCLRPKQTALELLTSHL